MLRYQYAAVGWLSRYTAEDRRLRLAEARELVDLLDAVGRHNQVATLRPRAVAPSPRLPRRG